MADEPIPPEAGHPVRVEPIGAWFSAAPGQTLLKAALASGVRLPSSCRNGTCRTCIAQVVEGRIEHTIEWPGLSREEKAQGGVLPCVAVALTPLVLRLGL